MLLHFRFGILLVILQHRFFYTVTICQEYTFFNGSQCLEKSAITACSYIFIWFVWVTELVAMAWRGTAKLRSFESRSADAELEQSGRDTGWSGRRWLLWLKIQMRGKLLAIVGDVGHPLRRVLAGQSSSLRSRQLSTLRSTFCTTSYLFCTWPCCVVCLNCIVSCYILSVVVVGMRAVRYLNFPMGLIKYLSMTSINVYIVFVSW